MNVTVKNCLREMANTLDSKAAFDEYKDTLFWPSNLGRLLNMIENFKWASKTFRLDNSNNFTCTLIRAQVDTVRFAANVKKLIAGVDIFKGPASNSRRPRIGGFGML